MDSHGSISGCHGCVAGLGFAAKRKFALDRAGGGRALLGVAAGVFVRRPAPSARAIRTVIDPPNKTTLNLTGDAGGPPVLSPDGAAIAFTATAADGKKSLWVRPMNSVEAHMLPDTEDATFPSGRLTVTHWGSSPTAS